MSSVSPGGRPPGDSPNGGHLSPIPPGGPRRRTRGPIRPIRGIYIWLALLTLFTVFASTAGAREALATRTQAVRQTIAANPPLSRTITVQSTWNAVQGALTSVNSFGPPPTVTPAVVSEIGGELHADFNQGVVSLQPTSTDQSLITTPLNLLPNTLPGTGGTPVKIELTERQPFPDQMRLVSGRYPVATPAPPASTGNAMEVITHPGAKPIFVNPKTGKPIAASSGDGTAASQLRHSAPKLPVIQVVLSTQTAKTFGLHTGSTFEMVGPERATTGQAAKVTIQVSGIVAPIDPSSIFWTADPAILAPDLQGKVTGPYWAGAVMLAPGENQELLQYFSSAGMQLEWVFPLNVGSVTAQQVQPLANALDLISTQVPTLTGNLAPVADALTTSSNLLFALDQFIATAQAVDTLLWLLYVSLTITGLAVLLLAGRMVAMRRSAELTLIRARGASLRQIFLGTAAGAALICVPAAVIGVALGILAVPGAGPQGADGAGGWWPPIAVLVVAVLGPALIAAWQHRLPKRGITDGRQIRARRRLIIEVMLIAAAVAGIVVFRNQGSQAGSGVNLYTSAAPVLIAIPVVIIILRLYPLALRGLLRLSARTSRAPAFLGLARASRTALTPALPAFALVLALTVAAFAGMVRDAVTNGEVAASWQSAGADVTVTPAANLTIPPNAVREMADVPGVSHATTVWNTLWETAEGAQLNVLAVDPASYAALVASSQGYPQVRAGLIAVPSRAGAPQPVLASPAAVAELGAGVVSLSTNEAVVAPVQVRVAGVLSSTPAFPGSSAFVIMPVAAIRSTATPATPIPVNEMLLNGGSIDQAQLAKIVQRTLFGATVTFRSDVLAGLTGGPLQHGAFTLFTLAVGVAAALGLAVMLLELALGAAERDSTLARLATMGLGEGQRAWVVALEVLPAVIAAGLAGWACAVALPRVLAPDINLSVFTGFTGSVPLAANVASIAVPLVGLALVAVVSLGIEIRWGRRRGAASLRVGE
jgi:putative ABC transport system permease protein